jgi:hypothetical protein
MKVSQKTEYEMNRKSTFLAIHFPRIERYFRLSTLTVLLPTISIASTEPISKTETPFSPRRLRNMQPEIKQSPQPRKDNPIAP